MKPDGKATEESMSVLLADDDLAMRSLISDELQDEGYSVFQVADGHDALDCVDECAPDLILTDLRMPHGGLELVARFRARAPKTPIILMTAFGSIEAAVSAIQGGATDYLTKPLNLDELLYRIRQVSDRYRIIAENRELTDQLFDGNYWHNPQSPRARAVFDAYQKRFSTTMSNHGVQGYQVMFVLKDALERALVLGSTDSILPDDLPEGILEADSAAPASTNKYHGTIKEAKKQLVVQALQQANGDYIEAAKTLGMHPNSLLRLIRNLDLKAVKAGMQGPE